MSEVFRLWERMKGCGALILVFILSLAVISDANVVVASGINASGINAEGIHAEGIRVEGINPTGINSSENEQNGGLYRVTKLGAAATNSSQVGSTPSVQGTGPVAGYSQGSNILPGMNQQKAFGVSDAFTNSMTLNKIYQDGGLHRVSKLGVMANSSTSFGSIPPKLGAYPPAAKPQASTPVPFPKGKAPLQGEGYGTQSFWTSVTNATKKHGLEMSAGAGLLGLAAGGALAAKARGRAGSSGSSGSLQRVPQWLIASGGALSFGALSKKQWSAHKGKIAAASLSIAVLGGGSAYLYNENQKAAMDAAQAKERHQYYLLSKIEDSATYMKERYGDQPRGIYRDEQGKLRHANGDIAWDFIEQYAYKNPALFEEFVYPTYEHGERVIYWGGKVAEWAIANGMDVHEAEKFITFVPAELRKEAFENAYTHVSVKAFQDGGELPNFGAIFPIAAAGAIKNTGKTIPNVEASTGSGVVNGSNKSPLQGAKGTGKITGSLNGLTDAEKKVVNDLTARGKNVEIIPKDPNSKVKTPDFKVDGVKTELKTLENPNVNTGITRIQKGLKQGAETVIIDARDAGLTVDQAKQIINRASGTYPNRTIPGKVEIWTNEGTITYP
ncbi:hypothetical protein NDK47_23095 [Brevibacillus ruminantium]|uniref:tRNA nuclease CdiA C-terminal domain-containing protein n=1 Tax=Brevibacillus ruminantium TaxID=2950604 RepID=A0ABY4WCS7_9BACL|nr:hypothetical protein [Brevibacillus ruminantium]USG64978.1 hypothetical protein NDK47_23095 [Brevibacillus ruminantium]